MHWRGKEVTPDRRMPLTTIMRESRGDKKSVYSRGAEAPFVETTFSYQRKIFVTRELVASILLEQLAEICEVKCE